MRRHGYQTTMSKINQDATEKDEWLEVMTEPSVRPRPEAQPEFMATKVTVNGVEAMVEWLKWPRRVVQWSRLTKQLLMVDQHATTTTVLRTLENG